MLKMAAKSNLLWLAGLRKALKIISVRARW